MIYIMINIVIAILLIIFFYQQYSKKENFNVLSKYSKIKGSKKDLDLLKKILYYVKSFENTDVNLEPCSNKYSSFDELIKYNKDILNENKTYIGKKLWIQNNKLNFCQEIIDKEEVDDCLGKKYNERLEHAKDLMKNLNSKSKWLLNYEEMYPENNIEKKYESNEINTNNIFYIYRLHSLLYELCENYKIDKDSIKLNNLSKLNLKPLLGSMDINDLLALLLNSNIPTRNNTLIEEIIKKNNIKEMNSSFISKKITQINKLINNFNIMSCDFISFNYIKN